jgi:hypothetical protein
MTKCKSNARQSGQVDGIGAAAKGDVVAEPLRQAPGVAGTSDPGQQRGVIEGGAIRAVELQPLPDPQRDQRRAEDMLHWLAESQIGCERQRCDQFGKRELAIFPFLSRMHADTPAPESAQAVTCLRGS